METKKTDALLLPSGGYRKLKSFQLARLIYDITGHFAALYIPADSRTRDQMIQAARSGVQNIAEGSVEAATSAKLELNLYNVARASLEELKLDYEDFLRQHQSPIWTKDSAFYREFIARRICDKAGFKAFIRWAETVPPSAPVRTAACRSALVANATRLLIATAAYFLKRQIESKAKAFLANGGFAERMAQMRRQNRGIAGK